MAPSKLLQTALAQTHAYNATDFEAVFALRNADCLHQILPLSLRQPALNSEDYRAYYNQIFPQFLHFKVHILETTVDQDAHRVVFHVRSSAETTIGPYSNEYFATHLAARGHYEVRGSTSELLGHVDLGISSLTRTSQSASASNPRSRSS